MAMKKWIALLAAVAFVHTAAWAQEAEAGTDSYSDSSITAPSDTPEAATSQYYGELGYTTLSGTSNAVSSGKFKPKMLRGVVGKTINPWLNGELMLGLGASSTKVLPAVPAAVNRVDAEVNTLLALYATPTMHFGNGGRVYARLGWANITFSDLPLPAPGPLQTRSLYSKHDSLSWGLGASFPITQNLSLGADYMLYYKRKGEKLDGLTVNLGYKF